jgi:hypothetical protein
MHLFLKVIYSHYQKVILCRRTTIAPHKTGIGWLAYRGMITGTSEWGVSLVSAGRGLRHQVTSPGCLPLLSVFNVVTGALFFLGEELRQVGELPSTCSRTIFLDMYDNILCLESPEATAYGSTSFLFELLLQSKKVN